MRWMIEFNKAVMKQPIWVQVWSLILVAANGVVPLFYLDRLEARVTLGVVLASGILMTALFSRFGYARILGLGHILWIPLVGFLWIRVSETPANDFFGIWIRSLIGINVVSLLIDIVDVGRFVAGDREPNVPRPQC